MDVIKEAQGGGIHRRRGCDRRRARSRGGSAMMMTTMVATKMAKEGDAADTLSVPIDLTGSQRGASPSISTQGGLAPEKR